MVEKAQLMRSKRCLRKQVKKRPEFPASRITVKVMFVLGLMESHQTEAEWV